MFLEGPLGVDSVRGGDAAGGLEEQRRPAEVTAGGRASS